MTNADGRDSVLYRVRTQRVEIPVHYDLWMMGAQTGYIASIKKDGAWMVRMDNRRVRRLVPIAPRDQEFCKLL